MNNRPPQTCDPCNEPNIFVTPPEPCNSCGPVQMACPDPEICPDGEVKDACCIQYNGPDLPFIGVKNKDRLCQILAFLNINHASTGIVVGQTNTVTLSGSGVLSDPVKANVVVSPDTGNLLTAELNGLKVVITKDTISKILSTIQSDQDLTFQFCQMVNSCINNYSCPVSPDDVTVTLT